MSLEFFTIGVYNSTEQEFFNKLTSNEIDTFCDIRQRRGVRGAKYAFVNSNRLQNKLKELNIRYDTDGKDEVFYLRYFYFELITPLIVNSKTVENYRNIELNLNEKYYEV